MADHITAQIVSKLYGDTEPPLRDHQNGREFVDLAIENFIEFLRDNTVPLLKGYDFPQYSDSSTSARVYVKDGYTYELSVKCVAWPGMKES